MLPCHFLIIRHQVNLRPAATYDRVRKTGAVRSIAFVTSSKPASGRSNLISCGRRLCQSCFQCPAHSLCKTYVMKHVRHLALERDRRCRRHALILPNALLRSLLLGAKPLNAFAADCAWHCRILAPSHLLFYLPTRRMMASPSGLLFNK